MDRKEIAKKLVMLAKSLVEEKPDISKQEIVQGLGKAFVASLGDREWLLPEDVAIFCPKCAGRMKEKKIAKVKSANFFTAYKKLPWDECIAKAKAQGADNPEAVCGYIKWHVSPKYKK
jgi:hypothetical protein